MLVEDGACTLPHVIGHMPIGDQRDRLAQLERCLLALAVERALSPGVEHVQALLGLSRRARVPPVHVEAERAPVELRGADIDQTAQLVVDLDRR